MRIFLKFILIIFLIFTVNTIGQNNSRELIKDQKLYELLKKAKNDISKTKEIQIKASQKTTKIVSQTKNKIVSLNTNVKELKTDLNETSKKLNYITDTNAGVKFILLPISDTQKNKW
jgi:archaellum component FlaC